MAVKVAVFVGSLRDRSYNHRLALALQKLGPDDWQYENVPIDEVPYYDQDSEAEAPESVARLKRAVEEADALMFVTPEYNRSIPGVLKNALDHASRPYGDSAFPDKPAGIIGVSIGAIGTAVAQQHLRTILAYLDMPTLGQPEAFLKADDVLTGDGGIAEGSREFLQDWMDAYLAWVRHHAG